MMKPPNSKTKRRKPHQSGPGNFRRLAFSSEELLQQAVAGLLIRMPGITGVQILQGSQELGKDIIFTIRGGFGEPLLCACVVKNAKITGNVSNSGGARTIFLQTEQAFDSDHLNGFGGNVHIERVYIVTPFDLAPSTITSIYGKLKDRAGQVNFIGGAQLFDLFKQHWPDYLADEATLIQQHLKKTRNVFAGQSPLPSLAFQYSLGSVPRRKKVYVAQNFFREINLYKMGRLLTLSLPKKDILGREFKKDDISNLKKALTDFARVLGFLKEWGLCSSAYHAGELRSLIDKFINELTSEWQRTVDIESRGKTRIAKTVFLHNTDDLELSLEKLNDYGLHHLSTLKETLDRLSRTVTSTTFDGLNSLSNKDFLDACFINDCARAAPEGVFVLSNKKQTLTLPKTILDQWDQSLFIVGAPGFGKTSFCRWYALHDTERFSLGKSNILPVYVSLHQLSSEPISTFEKTFLKTLGQSALIAKTAKNAPARIRLFLDGLDEIPSATRRREIVDLVKRGVGQNPDYQVVLTSRDYIYGRWLNWLPKIYLSEFGDSEVKEFIDKWLGKGSEINERFCLQLAHLPALRSLMRTPLLATLIIMVFRQTGRLPESRTRLYEIFIDLLSGGWDMAKGILRGSNFGPKIKMAILGTLARRLHEFRRKEFSDNEIKTAIQSSLPGPLINDWEQLRDEIVVDGLISRSAGVLQFSHLSLQEFLTAKDFMGSPDPSRVLRALEVYLDGDDWWRGVLKFYIGLSSEPKEIVDWLSTQIAGQSHRLSVPHAHELLAGIIECFPDYPITAIARKVEKSLAYSDTLSFLQEVESTLRKHA